MMKILRNLEQQNFGIVTANHYVIHIDPMSARYDINTIGAFNQRREPDFSALGLLIEADFTKNPPLLGLPIFGNGTVTTRTLLDGVAVERYLVR
jgi:hypothetical protein